jgi:putative peptidoglycan lipid II flippase
VKSRGQREIATVRGIGAAALLLAGAGLLSRVLGYGREVLLAYMAGAGKATDAYSAAFTIPDLLNHLLAGSALAIAFIPQYVKHRESGDEQEANRFFGTVLGTLGVIAIVATVVLFVFAEAFVELLFGKFDPETRVMTVRFMRIVLPAQIFFVAGGTIKATLLARGRFGAAALAPLIYNVAIIAGGALLGPVIGVEGFAWGVLVGALLGPFGAPLVDALGRVKWRLRFAPHDRAFLVYLLLALPLMIGFSLTTVDEWYEKIFGAALASGTVAHLNYARKLMLVPVAVVGQSVATAALPALTQLWAEGKANEVNRALSTTLRATLAMGLTMAAGFFVLANPIVTVLYERGAFTPTDTISVAAILAVLCFAVPAWVTQQVINRAFYARSDTWRPMLLGTAVAAAAFPLYAVLAKEFAVTGIAWAGVIGMSVSAVLTILLARGLHSAPLLLSLLDTLWRSGAIAGVAGLAGWAVVEATGAAMRGAPSLAMALTQLAAGGLVFALSSTIGLLLMGDEPTKDTVKRLLYRLGVPRLFTPRR